MGEFDYKTLSAVIAAGGKADRFGQDIPKQFIELEGVPIVVRSIEPFVKHPECTGVAVAVPAEWVDWMKGQVKERNWKDIVKVVKGGKQRGDSVYAGLKALKETDIVLVHDAARPFITTEMITKTAMKAWEYGGAAAAVPITDTIKRERDGIIIGTINRNGLWRVQTPQAFRFKVIMKVYKIARKQDFQGTDDAALLERFTGIKVKLVPGSEINIKITTPEDLKFAAAFARIMDEL